MTATPAERLAALAVVMRDWADECEELAAMFTAADDRAIRVRPIRRGEHPAGGRD